MAKLLKVIDCDGVKRGELTREQVRDRFRPEQIEYVDGQSAVRIIGASSYRSSASLTADDTEAFAKATTTTPRIRERHDGWRDFHGDQSPAGAHPH
jgi:hypothetical protein